MRSTVHNGQMSTRNPDRDALRDAIALVRARTDTETDLMLPQVLDANEDGTVTVDPTFARGLAALVTISRDLSKMVDHELLDQYRARKLAATGSGAP
jgi:glutamate synthase domain-containing protein 1